MNTRNLMIVSLSVCVLMSTGLAVIEVKKLKYCGPSDNTLKYKITPWPDLTPGMTVNVTATFTPVVDIFTSTMQYKIISEKYHQVISAGTLGVSCKKVPQLCNLAKGETITLSFTDVIIRDIPIGFKGTFSGRAEIYNQDHVMWSCFEGKAVL